MRHHKDMKNQKILDKINAVSYDTGHLRTKSDFKCKDEQEYRRLVQCVEKLAEQTYQYIDESTKCHKEELKKAKEYYESAKKLFVL